MNAYRSILQSTGLNAGSGTSMNNHWLYLWLASMGDAEAANPTANSFDDPAKEVLHRLRNYSGFAAQELAKLLTPMVK